MVRPKSSQPTELELQLLKILWKSSPQPVRDIRKSLQEQGRDIAHTSVITTLNSMVRKKYLKRTLEGNTLYFSPAVPQEAMARRILGHIVEQVFGGSVKATLLSLFESDRIDADELQELKRLIQLKSRENQK